MIIGFVIGESKPTSISAQTSRPLAVGEYIIIDSEENRLLGLVEKTIVSSAALTDVHNYDEAVESKEIADINSRDKSFTTKIMILGSLSSLKKGVVVIPAIPPFPGTPILEASKEDLESVFNPSNSSWSKIGTLLRNPQIELKININKIVTRHFGILAMTGMGKSNLVAIIAKEIAKLNGTLIIFDYHNDYDNLNIKKMNVMDAKINPRLLDANTLADVLEIRENADVQQRILRLAFTQNVKESKEFWDELYKQVEFVGANPERKEDRHSADRVCDKIDDARHRFADILDPDIIDPISLIKEFRINILNISEFSEKQANVVLAYYLQELLTDKKLSTITKNSKNKRKKYRFNSPVFVIIEEAHVFIPKFEDTHAKYWASKIAREGRKFGLGIGIVSQRPRNIDSNVLSQIGSFAIMKIIQEDDQRQIAYAVESISKDLISQLTSLNVGDAVLVGQCVNLPTLIHIDEAKEKIIGSDPNAVEEWNKMMLFNNTTMDSQELVNKDLLL